MPRGHFRAEESIRKLLEAEVAATKGKSTAEVCKKLGVAEQTYLPLSARVCGLEDEQEQEQEQET